MKENKANKKGRKLLWGTVIITMILSFMFFYVLYCSNNKYMTREEKAIHGLLYADGSYESFPVYYLSREWEYYPDALLTPEDDLDKYYFRYISIGEYGGMELGNSERSPYGSGTYRLKIMLPAEQHTYGLYLPEIFQHIICMWMVFWSDRWEIRTRIIMWNGLRTECLPSRPILH